MKNIIIWMVFMCAIMSSCNNDYFEHIDMCEQNKDIKNSSLLCEMSSFNDSLLNTKTLTRLSYRNRLNYLSIVCADAMGAYSGGCTGAKMGSVIGHPHVGAAIGAVICGGFSSYKCYDLLYHKNILYMMHSCFPLILEQLYFCDYWNSHSHKCPFFLLLIN